MAVSLLIAAGALVWLLHDSAIEQPAAALDRSTTIKVVRDYQFAVAELLRTGDQTSLVDLIAPGFIDQRPTLGFDNGGTGLTGTLLALRQTLPAVTVSSEIKSLDDNIATMTVTISSSDGAAMPAEAGRPPMDAWSFEESLRVVDGQITERWGPTIPFSLEVAESGWYDRDPGSAAELPEAFVTSDMDSALRVMLVAASAERFWPSGRTLFLVQEGRTQLRSIDGFFLVKAGTPSSDAPVLTFDAIAEVGDLVIAEQGFLLTPLEPSTLLTVGRLDVQQQSTIRPPGPQPTRPSGPDGAIANSALAPLLVLPGDPLPVVSSVYVGRLSVPQGAPLPLAEAGSVVIYTVESGSLLHSATGETVAQSQSLAQSAEESGGFVASEPSIITMVTFTFDQLSASRG